MPKTAQLKVAGEKKQRKVWRARLLTTEQLRAILTQYNRPDEEGNIQTLKKIAEKLGVAYQTVQEGLTFLKGNHAKFDMVRKDSYYKEAIAPLMKSNPELFELNGKAKK